MLFLQKTAGYALAIAANLAPRFMARRLAPRLLSPRRQPPGLARTHQPIEIGNAGVAWQGYGHDPALPIALFVHGFNGNHAQWQPIETVVKRAGYRCIFLDPPGHGASKSGQRDPVLFGDAVAAAFKQLGPISLYLGHSMGVLATSDTMTADAYVLLSSPVVMHHAIEPTAAKLGLNSRAVNALLQAVGRAVGVDPRDLDIRASLAGRSAPALIIHNRADRQIRFGQAEDLLAAWPNAQLFATDGLGHNRIMQDAKTVQQIAAFLAH